MTDLRKAAEMALGVLLDSKTRADEVAEAVKVIRQALDDKPAVKTYAGGKPNYCTPEQEPFAWMEDNEGNKYKIPEVNKGPLLKAMELKEKNK